MRALCARMGEAEARDAGEKIAGHLRGERWLETDGPVGLFLSIAGEPDTHGLFDRLLRDGGEVAVPRCRDDGALGFFRVRSAEDLTAGRYGLLEPWPGAEPVSPASLAIVLVPGLAFDLRGGRLGRGKGYYDRTFQRVDSGAPRLVGVGYSFQCVERVPTGALDRRLDAVVNETGSWCIDPGG